MESKENKDILQILGHPGKFAWIIFVLLGINQFPVAFNHLAMAVYGAVPPHRCHLPDNVAPDNKSIPETGGKLDSCHVWANYSYTSGQKVACPDGWDFSLTGKDSTIVNEWNLVCDRKYIPSLSTTVYFAGVMIGGLGCGSISDNIGRRPTMIVTMYMPILLGITVYLVESVPLFMLLRFCIGFLMQGLQTCSFVLGAEWCATSNKRVYATAFFECSWGLGAITLSGIAYIFKDWRHIQLAITLPMMLSLCYIWLVPESILWLLNKGRVDDALFYMKRAAKMNNIDLSTKIEDTLRDSAETETTPKTKSPTLWQCFRTPNLRKHTIAMFYIWFSAAIIYYGVSLQASRFTGDKYLNFFISGAVELPAYGFGVLILGRLGRRRPLCFYFLLGGVACILATTIPKATGNGFDIAWLSTALAWIGKFSAAGCWSVLFLYTSELFPTSVRNAGVGACASCARVGSLVTPQMILVGDYTYSWVPFVVVGLLAVGAGLVALVLPETKDLVFPDTFQQAEDLGKALKHRDTNAISNHAYTNTTVDSTVL